MTSLHQTPRRSAPACVVVREAAARGEDGVLGPRTLQAVQAMPPTWLVARFNGARLALLADLPTWPAFGRGWARRVAANLLEA